jgi:hypothetical protein
MPCPIGGREPVDQDEARRITANVANWRAGCGFKQQSPPDGGRLLFLGELEVTPRNLLVTVANLLSRCAVRKLQILCCAGAILLGPGVGPPNVLPIFATRGVEHKCSSAPDTLGNFRSCA